VLKISLPNTVLQDKSWNLNILIFMTSPSTITRKSVSLTHLDAELRAQLEAASLEANGLQSELVEAAADGHSEAVQQQEVVAAIQEELLKEEANLAAADAALNEVATDKALDQIAAEMAVNEIG